MVFRSLPNLRSCLTSRRSIKQKSIIFQNSSQNLRVPGVDSAKPVIVKVLYTYIPLFGILLYACMLSSERLYTINRRCVGETIVQPCTPSVHTESATCTGYLNMVIYQLLHAFMPAHAYPKCRSRNNTIWFLLNVIRSVLESEIRCTKTWSFFCAFNERYPNIICNLNAFHR